MKKKCVWSARIIPHTRYILFHFFKFCFVFIFDSLSDDNHAPEFDKPREIYIALRFHGVADNIHL